MLTMKPLSDHLAPATQRDVTVWQSAVVHLEENVIMQITLLDSDTHTMTRRDAEKAYRQEHAVGRCLDSLIREKPPPPAV